MVLKNKVALVTGASRGIGRRIALYLASIGCDIVIADKKLDSWKEFGEKLLNASSVMEEVENLGRRCLGLEIDISKKNQVEDLFNKAISMFRKIDILVNNAGGYIGDIENSWASKVSEEDIRKLIEVNLFGTIFCCQKASFFMKENRYGKIINIGSHAGMHALLGGFYAIYGVAKAGVIMYTKYLAQELGPYNINVNSISPGYVVTERLIKNIYGYGKKRQKYIEEVPLKRLAEPIDIANVVAFLADDKSSYINGQNIPICGGLVNF